MMISVYGIGWLTTEGYGCIRSGLHHRFEPGEQLHSRARRSIFSYPFKNFARLDGVSRMTACAVALAMQDAVIEYAQTCKQDIGIIGTSSEGSLVSDIAYFKDYIDNGRTLSRGNLFIYTLPSSPLGEAAIHFGLVGPLLYAAGEEKSLAAIMAMAAEMLRARETDRMLVGQAGEGEALYLVLAREEESGAFCRISEAQQITAAKGNIDGMIGEFSKLKDRKGVA
jgi:3-oxoacyl-[acyl-carrier-protein] synthase II